MFSWNHFWWDKVKKHASIYWYKLGKKHWKMMTFLRYVIANSTKNIEKSGLLKNMRQSIDTSWSKSIDPYKTKMWTYSKDAWLYLYKLSKFRSIPSRELSEICSTCISTVRHTGHKFLWVGFFLKDPYRCAHFRRRSFQRSLWVWPFGRRFSVRSWVAVYSLTVFGLAVYSLMMAIFMSSGLQFLPLPFHSWLEHVSFSSKTTFSLFQKKI